jgi:hypothetical protein
MEASTCRSHEDASIGCMMDCLLYAAYYPGTSGSASCQQGERAKEQWSEHWGLGVPGPGHALGPWRVPRSGAQGRGLGTIQWAKAWGLPMSTILGSAVALSVSIYN